jgi:N-hydroxyarylamine O-acetyltransferase
MATMNSAMTETEFDLAGYLLRIGVPAAPPPTAEGLAALHLAHATHIPFENLDVLLGKPIRLNIASLQQKLIRDRRGGYCFEQNILFAAALEKLGFNFTRLAARVRYRASRLLPRTHMLLAVEIDGIQWIADVGFGGSGLLVPIRLAANAEQKQFHWSYRLVSEGDAWVLQNLRPEGWQDLYLFTLERQELVDYEVANYYVSTHPDSAFTRTLAAQLPTPEARHILRNRELTVDRGTASETRVIRDDELIAVLAERFGLVIPAGTAFPDSPWRWGIE